KGLQAYFGDVPARFARHGPFVSELFSERVTVDGLFDLGTSFIAFGNVLMSTHTYFALNRNASPDRVNVGLVRIRAGADAGLVQDRIAARLAGGDVQVLTRQAFIDREIDYWNSTAAVGLLFVVGAFMGFVVGSVIVYQILYTSVSDHISEYATLKAMGFRDLYF